MAFDYDAFVSEVENSLKRINNLLLPEMADQTVSVPAKLGALTHYLASALKAARETKHITAGDVDGCILLIQRATYEPS
jgi:hypothetical protein